MATITTFICHYQCLVTSENPSKTGTVLTLDFCILVTQLKGYSFKRSQCIKSGLDPGFMKQVIACFRSLIISLIIIIIIALKGLFWDFLNLFTTLQTVSNTYTQVAPAQSCTNHMQNIKHLSPAICRVPWGMKGHKGRKLEYPEKTPNKFQKMPHTKARKFKPPQDSNLHSSTGCRLVKQTC